MLQEIQVARKYRNERMDVQYCERRLESTLTCMSVSNLGSRLGRAAKTERPPLPSDSPPSRHPIVLPSHSRQLYKTMNVSCCTMSWWPTSVYDRRPVFVPCVLLVSLIFQQHHDGSAEAPPSPQPSPSPSPSCTAPIVPLSTARKRSYVPVAPQL